MPKAFGKGARVLKREKQGEREKAGEGAYVWAYVGRIID